MQLVAYGAQDIYLTGNPQITFFKVVYRRHTNFSMESIKQLFDGTADFGRSVSATISRNGDLVYRMYLEHDASFTTVARGSDNGKDHTLAIRSDYGSHVIKEVELEIGGQRIDKHYGHWNSVYSQLTEFNPSGTKNTLFNRMSGNGRSISTDIDADGVEMLMGENNYHNGFTLKSEGFAVPPPTPAHNTAKAKLFIPLYFWFCRNPGLSLPLIALQYHEVKVNMKFENVDNLVVYDTTIVFGANMNRTDSTNINTSETSFDLWADYIYLDTDERRRFAQVSHEYLIEQLQFESKTGGGSMELNFNHPVKELIWSGVEATTFSSIPGSLFDREAIDQKTYQLKLNGHDRFKERNYRYFTRTQVWEHHAGFGCSQNSGDTIAVYSFALKPEEHQPSGTCNFSRIDNAELISSETASPKPIHIYAVNYNVLRIMSGMGGLAYSN